jgi:hypothetical protein
MLSFNNYEALQTILQLHRHSLNGQLLELIKLVKQSTNRIQGFNQKRMKSCHASALQRTVISKVVTAPFLFSDG